MKPTRCSRGHFYDSEIFSECPHCNPNAAKAAPIPAEENPIEAGVSAQTKPVSIKGTADSVVGWLVAVDGKHLGKDFRLKSGMNYIGRARSMDVQLAEDTFVSREKQAELVYDPQNNTFTLQPGASQVPFYLNENVVTAPVKLKMGDIISMGHSKLIFIPFCNDKIKWDLA